MSEELTKAIRDEVVLFLEDSLRERERLVHYGTILNGGMPSPTWALIDAEVRGLIEAYVEGGGESEPEPEPEPQEIEIGDLVRLTGRLWEQSEGFTTDGIYSVAGADEEGYYVICPDDGERYYIFEDEYWGAEIYMKASEL